MGNEEKHLRRIAAKKAKLEAAEKAAAKAAAEQLKLDEKYMKEALRQAKKAYALKEVPIGCVLVDNETGKVLSRGYNRRNTDHLALGHAEITVIKRGCKKLNDWRLDHCTLYVTLEPCQMCAGAIVQARVPRVVIGAMNAKAGCAGSIFNLLEEPKFNHRCEVVRGVLGEECSEMMSEFFKELRENRG